jgi:DNA-binding NarL/FixJ family response regulator
MSDTAFSGTSSKALTESPSSAGRIQVFLSDDDPQFSMAAAEMLSPDTSIALVGTGRSVEETLAAVSAQKFDVLVLDIYMSDGESLEAVQDVKLMRPGIKVLVITGGGWKDQQVASIVAGADGFLYKPFTSSDLAKAIKVIHSGKVFFDASALAEALSCPTCDAAANARSLSAEDLSFLELIRGGLSATEIAARLNTGIKAVYQRRYRLKSKLGLRSARELFDWARRRT